MTWIKLAIHPEHEKVLRLADLTGSPPDAAFVAAVRWFRWVDAHVENADTGISTLSFRAVARWPDDSLATAMLHADVDWLTKGRDGLLVPTRIDSHFSASAKRRALTAKRVQKHRCNARATPVRVLDPDPEETRIDHPPSSVTTAREVERAVGSLKVSALVRTRVGGLTGLSVKEIADAYAAVKSEAQTDGTLRDVDALVASRLLERRGQSMPTRKGGNLSGPLSEAASGVVGTLAALRRNRGRG